MDCESCVNYIYSEQTDEYICECNLDEDEFADLTFRMFKNCPYYRENDKYNIVRKQN